MFRSAHKWFRSGLAILTFLALASALQPAQAAQPSPFAKEVAEIRRFVETRMRSDSIPGLCIGFAQRGFTWVDGFGFADLENRVRASENSSFRLASVTKPMTAAGVLRLMEEGKLDLDAEVQTYVPYFPRKPAPVTVRQLLGHLGGISHYRDYDAEGHFKDHKDTRAALAVFADFDLVGEPGTKYQYSSYGYNLLGAVIEGAAGEPYGDTMRRTIWEPLGMQSTRLDDPDAIIPKRVRGYRRGPDGRVVHSEFVDVSSRFAAGGTRSTVADLLRFARGMREGKVLRPETVDLMWTPMTTRDGHSTGYGMGWNVRPVNGRFAVSHGGSQPETKTYIMLLPAADLSVAFACNYEEADPWVYVERVYEIVMGEPVNPRVYTEDRVDAQIYAAMSEAFSYGLAHFDRRRAPASSAPDTLERAFAYFNAAAERSALETDFDAMVKRIQEGRHPSSGSPFVVLGAHISAVLATHLGAKRLEVLHERGPIQMFADYVAHCRSHPKVPAGERLARPVEELVLAWQSDWEKTWSGSTRLLAVSSFTEPASIARRLAPLFQGTRVRPDFTADFSAAFEARLAVNDVAGALEAAAAAKELYPRAGRPCVDAGLGLLAAGDLEGARGQLRRAVELEPQGAGSASALNARASALHGTGRGDLALACLEIARELYPADANLCDSLGEIRLGTGHVEEAIAWYEKALEIDPQFESARRQLVKIRAEMESARGR